MEAKYSYVCFRCEHVQQRAPGGKCEACGSENIQSVQYLMHMAQLKIEEMRGGAHGHGE